MAIYTYCRVSTAEQAEEGESLETQQRQIQGYTQIYGFAATAHFVESGVSGLVPLGERPQGLSLLAILHPGDVVITPTLDRMFRSAHDALDTLTELRNRDVALHVIDLGGDFTANGIAKVVFTILATVADAKAERGLPRKRIVKEVRDQRAYEHTLDVAVPFGFARLDDGTLAEVTAEQDAIRKLLQARAEGLSFLALAGFIAGLGFPISHNRIREVLARYPSEEGGAGPNAPPGRTDQPRRSPRRGAPRISQKIFR